MLASRPLTSPNNMPSPRITHPDSLLAAPICIPLGDRMPSRMGPLRHKAAVPASLVPTIKHRMPTKIV